MGVGRADGFSNTNFVGAFSNGNQHEIHDTDATNEEGDCSNTAEHNRDHREEVTGWVGNVRAIVNSEVAGGTFEVSKSFSDLLSGGFGFLIIFYSDIDLLNLGIEVFNLFNIDDNRLVKIYTIEVDRVLGLLEGANNNKFVTGEREGFTDRFAGAKELKSKGMANDCRL